jgi:hypothetical protein
VDCDEIELLGDNGDRQQVIKTVHGVGYRFVADVDVVQRQRSTGSSPDLDPRIRFVEVAGGVSLAVAETGEGPYLVKTATWLTQVDKDTDNSPVGGIGFAG